jgi:hypothetical protein
MITTVTVTWRLSDKAIAVFYNSGFTLFSLILCARIIKMVTKTWREVFEKYYKACRLLFKENIPLGRPLKFSRPNSEVAVHRTVGRPPG